MSWYDLPQELLDALGSAPQVDVRERLRRDLTDENIDKWSGIATGGGGFGGWTKLVKGPGISRIEAFHNTTNQPVGSLGFREAPGRGPRIMDIKVAPKARGQGYANEMLEAFERHAGPAKMNDVGVGSTITNSPGFWERLADRWAQYPQTSRNIRSALDMRY